MRRIVKAILMGLGVGFVGSFIAWTIDPCYYHPYADISWFQGQYPYCESRSGVLTLQPFPFVSFAIFGLFGFAFPYLNRSQESHESKGKGDK